MMPYDNWTAEQPGDRHPLAATLATAVSLLLHGGVILILVLLNVSLPAPMADALRREAGRILRMRTVEVEPAAAEGAEGAGGAAAAAAAWRVFASEEDLRRQVEALRTAPDAVAVAPAAVPVDVLTGEDGTLVEPPEFPAPGAWDARQEIVAIDRRVAADEIPDLARRVLPRIERTLDAPDISIPVDTRSLQDGGSAFGVDLAEVTPPSRAAEAAIAPAAVAMPGDGAAAAVDVRRPATATGGELFEEQATDITNIRPIEELLRVKATVYTSLLDFKHAYFMLEIDRVSSEALPTTPKDIVFLLDSSNSMGDQRLMFCRNGIARAMKLLGAGDRFNVVAFRDSPRFCFPEWTAVSAPNVAAAQSFVESLSAGGNTDILTSLKTIRELPRTAGRPVIAVVITDGLPTAGVTGSSEIIREFTRLNDGAVSVYTVATIGTANTYLLDILSYANRGETRVVARGRWDIPDAIESLSRELAQPVLTDIALRFAQPELFEIYPVQTSNLYADRPLVLVGRTARDTGARIVMQAVGKAGETACDMIFDVDLAAAPRTADRDIRREWARQKIYHLVGRYARTPEAAILDEIRVTAADYRVPVPHEAMIGK